METSEGLPSNVIVQSGEVADTSTSGRVLG
jgi:hypothetical protein